MLETIIVILLILFLLGFFGRGRWGGPGRRGWGWAEGNLIYIILVVAVILLLFRLLR